MFKNTIKVLISQSFNNKKIIIENKFDLFGYKRCKRQLHNEKLYNNKHYQKYIIFRKLKFFLIKSFFSHETRMITSFQVLKS